MPQRTNLFQEIVEIIHTHMAGDATVEPSAMLPSRTAGIDREVDVVIRSETAGHEVVVSVEAVARSRKADVEWVDAMLGKHRDLPTSKLVLVAEKGFTAAARKAAVANYAVPLSPEDLGDDDPAFAVVNAIPSLWPKVLELTPEKAKLWVEQPDGETRWFMAPADLQIFLDDGHEMGVLVDVLHALYRSNWLRVTEQIGLANIAEDLERSFIMQVGPPWTAHQDGETRRVCLRGEDPPHVGELHPIEKIMLSGKAVITVSEVPLSHHRLGEVKYAYGEGKIAGQEALFVATEDSEEGKLTIRVRDDGTES